MRRIIINLWLVTLILMVSNLVGLSIDAAPKVELNISAAASLTDALVKIGKTYESKHQNIKLNFNFGSSGSLQAQIENGAPVDVFISASEKEMDRLESKKLLRQGTRTNLLKNQLVLIVSVGSKNKIKSFEDLVSDAVQRIALGASESVPAGQYAYQCLSKLGIWARVTQKVIYGTNVRAVLTYVESGNVDAGIVYFSDTVVSDKVKIVAVAAPDWHQPIIYPVAIIATTKKYQEAQRFLKALQADESKRVFEEYGFKVAW
ncbi:MAG TPA: molybdate ABC transporter substrate-binding protein [Bacillota bacterium]|jgi:molybdate transport system substrate-binding protein|nr:molybdate ABC transporter substrate-binding protein [Bacillota bacterium]HOL09025.1 molybdate ABC transporter substrate-binding protein [Bacillota bacterium]HPO96700.1 molybdate ABC transporter substrate-binding protein [Bacillota bacterium]